MKYALLIFVVALFVRAKCEEYDPATIQMCRDMLGNCDLVKMLMTQAVNDPASVQRIMAMAGGSGESSTLPKDPKKLMTLLLEVMKTTTDTKVIGCVATATAEIAQEKIMSPVKSMGEGIKSAKSALSMFG